MSTKKWSEIEFKSRGVATPEDNRRVQEILRKAEIKGIDIDLRNIKERLESLENTIVALYGVIAVLLMIILLV